MATSASPTTDPKDLTWFILGRRQEYEGEARANVVRIAAIAAFYLIELANYHGVHFGLIQLPKVVDRQFHLAVTAIAVSWTMTAITIQLCLSKRIFPRILKHVTTIIDISLMTGLLMISNGPASPLVVGYFLIIVVAMLRFSLSLIRVATMGCMSGYLLLLGYAKWYGPASMHIPRYYQIMFLLALGLTGIILGQTIRRVRELADEYATWLRRESPAP